MSSNSICGKKDYNFEFLKYFRTGKGFVERKHLQVEKGLKSSILQRKGYSGEKGFYKRIKFLDF